MTQHKVHSYLQGRLLMLGCGSIGQAVLPLILRHLGVDARPDHHRHRRRARPRGGGAVRHRLPRDGADPGELSPACSSRWSARRFRPQPVGRRQQHRHRRASATSAAPSISTPWSSPGAASISTAACRRPQRSNYALREGMLKLRRELGRGPTAVSAQGANPGLVSQLVKEAALIVARDTGLPHARAHRPAGLGAPVPRPRRQGDPHRRARHPGRRPRPSGPASSSTPGRSTASSPRAASRPSSAGARTSATSPRAACATPAAAARRST